MRVAAAETLPDLGQGPFLQARVLVLKIITAGYFQHTWPWRRIGLIAIWCVVGPHCGKLFDS